MLAYSFSRLTEIIRIHPQCHITVETGGGTFDEFTDFARLFKELE
jgi:hypothetical protein